jgi:hypothetical protein
MPTLPPSAGIDVGKLAGAFRRVSQSYKFLFFRAILDEVVEGANETIPYPDILIRMCEAAWWPSRRYRLLIAPGGAPDELTRMMDRLGDDPYEEFSADRVRAGIGSHVTEQRARGFLRRVPNRFLQPWLTEEYDRVKDNAFDRFVRENSGSLRERKGLPYSVLPDGSGIALSPRWVGYLLANMPIVRGWADMEWLSWVQARNPNVPVTMGKLGPPGERVSLSTQHAFLRAAMRDRAVSCIYTGEEIPSADMSLDHFVPRSYVGHDRIWNLVPMSKGTNSAKGARLPGNEFVAKLAAFHHGVILSVDPLSDRRWRRFGEEYASDLRVSPEGLANIETLTAAFGGTVGPMLMMASRMGFPQGWP